MKQPGKAIEVKDEIKALLDRHGFARRIKGEAAGGYSPGGPISISR